MGRRCHRLGWTALPLMKTSTCLDSTFLWLKDDSYVSKGYGAHISVHYQRYITSLNLPKLPSPSKWKGEEVLRSSSPKSQGSLCRTLPGCDDFCLHLLCARAESMRFMNRTTPLHAPGESSALVIYSVLAHARHELVTTNNTHYLIHGWYRRELNQAKQDEAVRWWGAVFIPLILSLSLAHLVQELLLYAAQLHDLSLLSISA